MVTVGLLLGVLCIAFHVLVPTPEEQLAAFDAAHAVPDEDNAAPIYAELLRGEEVPPEKLETALAPLLAAVQDPVSFRQSRVTTRKLRELELPEGMDPNLLWIAASRPWKSAEFPEFQAWLDTHRHRIDRMLAAARKPSCHFPLWSAPGRVGLLDVPLGALRQNVFLLLAAAGNDLGEGNADAALAKWRVLMTTGRHLRDQPNPSHLLSGVAVEAMALLRFKEFVIEGPATDRQLQDLAILCEKTDRPWESLRRDINHVWDLSSRLLEDRRPLKFRMYMRYRRIRYGDRGWLEDRPCELYHRMLSDRQGVRILIELRRFKDRTGRWPEGLNQIASTLSPGTLVDPICGGSYVYRLLEDGFSLYSVGPNRVDENGRHKWDGPDDWPIWPPRGRGEEREQEKQ